MLDVLTIILLIIACILICKAKRKTEEAEKEMEKLIKAYEDRINNLEHLKLQEENKNNNLKAKSTKLAIFKQEVENIAYGKRPKEEKVDKIIEVIQSSNKNNF